ncbi:hypothetical protein HAX54_024076, partial [Datura stramonium]|nr:hypothetical protein [Datura stramonium]
MVKGEGFCRWREGEVIGGFNGGNKWSNGGYGEGKKGSAYELRLTCTLQLATYVSQIFFRYSGLGLRQTYVSQVGTCVSQ